MENLTFKNRVWKCATCGVEKLGTVHQMRRVNCSKSCMAKAYKTQLSGSNNPNHRNRPLNKCKHCGKEYHSYQKNRKFCSQECYRVAKPKKEPKIKKPVASNEKVCKNCSLLFKCVATSHKINCSQKCRDEHRKKKVLEKLCVHCGEVFRYYLSQKRIYCSYKCHLASGGAFRAGIAAAKATLKYGPKKDANHNEVFAELRKFCAVYDMSTAGMGMPDGVAWINEAWHLFDVKNPKTAYGRRGLNKVQQKWLETWAGGPVYLIYTIEEAARFAQGNFENIKFARGGIVDDVPST